MAGAFTFIHTADLHLDAPFKGIDSHDTRVREALVESTYAALDRIVELAIGRRVDFVLVAGDAYNSRDKSVRAQLRFGAAMQRLADANIPVHLVQGNHDPADGFSAGLSLPPNVRYFSTAKVERVEVLDAKGASLCALYGRGYATAATKMNLARDYHRSADDVTAIGVLHANVGGVEGYEPYAPCTLDDLRASGMDYWALGHIHKPAELLTSPPIRYCGSPQGLNPKEDGAHGCWLITMDSGRVTAQEFIETATVRWAREQIDASKLETVDDVRSALADACGRMRVACSGVPVVARIELAGRSDAHAALSNGTDFDDLVAEARDTQMALEPWLWLDRVRNLTRPEIDVEFLLGVEDFTGDLARIARDLAADPSRAADLVDDALAGIDGAFGRRERDPAVLIEAARDESLDRLAGGEA